MTARITLSGPVGNLSRTKVPGNFPADVKAVKRALRKLEIAPALVIDSHATPNLTVAIHRFQNLFSREPDGRIDPAPGGTLRRLNELASGKAIVVNLHNQVLDASAGLSSIYHFDVAAGDAEHPTPPGYYKVLRKFEKYRSRKYDVQMDYAMFFHGGYAIHMAYFVGITSYLKLLGADSLGSHGCVRLSESDAKELFAWTPRHTPVVVLPKA